MKRQDLYWTCTAPKECKLAHEFFAKANAYIDKCCDATNFETLDEIQQDIIAQFLTASVDKLIKDLETA